MSTSLAALLLVFGPATASAWIFGNADSYTNSNSMSGDGRYVAFHTDATNLVPNDTNGQTDIFRLDTQTGEVVRVSLDSLGNQATGGRSELPAINSDGTKIAFISTATNLVAGDTNAAQDVFLRDLSAGTTIRVNVSYTGGQTSGGNSFSPSISGDGNMVAFSTDATNLVFGGGDTNNFQDVYVRNMWVGITVRASVDNLGIQVAFGDSLNPSISSNGTRVAFESKGATFVPGDTNEHSDIFVRDLIAGTTVRASVDSSGNQTLNSVDVRGSFFPSLNSDGSKVVFQCDATNLVPDVDFGVTDLYVRDLWAGTTVRASGHSWSNQPPSGVNYSPSISSDGTKVAFHSPAANLVPDDTNGFSDVFVHDLSAGTTVRANAQASGLQPNNLSERASISADGTRVAFSSAASNLVFGDENERLDVIVRDLVTNEMSVPVTLSGFELE